MVVIRVNKQPCLSDDVMCFHALTLAALTTSFMFTYVCKWTNIAAGLSAHTPGSCPFTPSQF